MKVIIQGRETADINGEDSSHFAESLFDPPLALRILLATQKCTSDTRRNAMTKRRDVGSTRTLRAAVNTSITSKE